MCFSANKELNWIEYDGESFYVSTIQEKSVYIFHSSMHFLKLIDNKIMSVLESNLFLYISYNQYI